MYGYETSNQEIRDQNVRAGDADREATAERLRRHHAEGRLDSEEFQERLDRCFAARTVGELAELGRDLPPDPARGDAVGHTRFGGPGYLWMVPLVPIIVAIIAIHVIVGVARGPWFLIPLLILARFTIFRHRARPWSRRRDAAL